MKVAAGTVVPQMELQDPLVRTVEANIEAENTYVPSDRVYPGRITYFYAEDPGGTPAHEDNRLHWAKMTAAGLDIHRIPGTHISMREEPNVALLAKIVTECLKKAHQTS
jgi:thioesterase domain-containing protein